MGEKGQLGKYAFMGGLVLSVLLAVLADLASVSWVIALSAIIVALMNIQVKETQKLLLWTIGMGVFGVGALAAGLSVVPTVGTTVADVVTSVGVFFTSIAGVFLLKEGYTIFSK